MSEKEFRNHLEQILIELENNCDLNTLNENWYRGMLTMLLVLIRNILSY